jgi:tetratricopeptide (TPR) repeat protein
MDAAVDHFLEALKHNPDHFLAHKNLGVTLLRQGRLEAAADQLLKASAIEPDDPAIHKMLGRPW